MPIIAMIIFAASFGNASAATFTVTKTADTNDGVCNADCSLREAIIAANSAGGTNTIVLPAGTYTLTIPGTGENAAATGDLDITTGNLTINGAGMANTIIQACSGASCTGIDRVFHILNNAVVSISGVTIRNGYTLNAGGGIYNVGTANLTLTNVTLDNNFADNQGGGMENDGTATATLTNVIITNNDANCSDGGGGVYNYGTMSMTNVTVSGNTCCYGAGVTINGGTITITDSTISNNIADYEAGGLYVDDGTATLTNVTINGNKAGTEGGGIYNDTSLTMTNVTISGNESDLTVGNDSGGGIYNRFGATVNMTNCTIAFNIAHGSNGSGIYNSGTANLLNTLLANNDNENCAGTGTLNAQYSLSSDSTCSFVGSNNITNTGNPNIGPLANNGGTTQTHALLAGSPAIDTADPGSFPSTDQRGVTRPQGAGPDIGAYEFTAAASIPTMTEWGMIIFVSFAGIVSVLYLRRQRRAEI